MGLIRSKKTKLTPEDEDELTEYLWPIVREMIKTAIENIQNLTVEGCYIPLNWADDFSKEYLDQIQFICLIMTKKYILNHFRAIKEHANAIESRLNDEEFTLESALEENEHFLKFAAKYRNHAVLIEDDYDINIDFLQS